MEGNIDIEGRIDWSIGRTLQTVKTNFTFDEGAKLKGNLTALYTNGEQNFIFKGGSGGIEGNISASGGLVSGTNLSGNGTHSTTQVNITFKGENASIKKGASGTTGQVIAEGAILNNNAKYHAHNRILFENNGQIGEGNDSRVNIIARPRQSQQGGDFGGAQSYNLIQFNKQANIYLQDLKTVPPKRVTSTSLNILNLELSDDQSRVGDTNALDINIIEAGGATSGNLIGRGLLKFSNTGTTAKDLTINTNAIDTPSVSNIAKGKLTANKIISKNGGKNTILIEEIAVDNGIFAGDNAKNTIFIGQGNSTIGTNGIDNQGNGSSGDYAIVTGASGENIFTLDSANLTIAKNIYTASGGTTTFNLNGTNSTLTLQGKKNQITTISATGANSTLNLSSNAQATLGQAHNFNLLEIGTKGGSTASTGLTANNLTFVVSVDTQATQGDTKSTIGGVATKSDGTYGYAYSDRIIIHNVGTNTRDEAKSANLAVAIDPSQTSSIHYTKDKGTEIEHNIAVATIKNGTTAGTTNPLVNLTSIETINGGEKIQVEFVKVATNENGKVNGVKGKGQATPKGYTTYFLGKAISLGVDNTTQQALTSALSINYDLYIANLNSLNKRMGELRDNPYTQGVWARVFGGLQESNFGLGARTSYVTAQGGYDYALETEGAKNYIGLAFSYMHSKGESNKATQASNAINVSGINTIYLSNIQSSGYEIALYNSYVSNVGLYNDTIAKLSYITSDFSLSNSSDHNNTANNLGFTLSNEVGYRFILGEQQDYFIDPQLELSLGYLNQSDFTTKMKTRSGKGNQLKALQESVFLTRTRLGASFGKKIVEQDKNISLYVGTFYEYDLVTGGSNKLTTSTTKAYNPEFASNGRVVLNVGSNLELNQSTRVYVDVEKSFGDKLRTQLQFNLGARYSFGEKTSIENAKAQTTAPLRVGNTPTEETEKAQIVPNVPNKTKEDTRTKATN
ncbi:autotransporter outer membrane beta-barrel domain-containing protein [Helicobacter enhydrae]|nr:autotransporter outer membrane beta-barrel domain-containing protein [Helicobacter enhydrae]